MAGNAVGLVNMVAENCWNQLLTTGTCFDVVVCSRVLCSITDDLELDNVLRDLRRLAADSGTAFIAVCNPFYLTAASTEVAQKHLPAEPKYADTFPYTKTLAINGNRRTEVHRATPLINGPSSRQGSALRKRSNLTGLTRYPSSPHPTTWCSGSARRLPVGRGCLS